MKVKNSPEIIGLIKSNKKVFKGKIKFASQETCDLWDGLSSDCKKVKWDELLEGVKSKIKGNVYVQESDGWKLWVTSDRDKKFRCIIISPYYDSTNKALLIQAGKKTFETIIENESDWFEVGKIMAEYYLSLNYFPSNLQAA